MGDLYANSGFELDEAWEFFAQDGGAHADIAGYSNAEAHDGIRSGKITCKLGFIGPPRLGAMQQTRDAIIGATYAVTGWTHSDSADGSAGFVRLRGYYDDPNLSPFPLRVIYETVNAQSGGWALQDFGDIVAPAANFESGFLVNYQPPPPPTSELGEFIWYLDDFQAFTLSEPMAKSTLTSFLTKLSTALAAIDPNIGKMFSTDRRKFSRGELEAAAAFEITEAGIFDDVTRIGKKVTRFWIAETQIDTSTLTNCSAEYVHRIQLTGFYSFEQPDADSQRTALELATIEILDKLNTKSVEQADLSTGDGYHGFLNARPRMLNPVQPAALDDGLQGHMVELEVTFAEEVALV